MINMCSSSEPQSFRVRTLRPRDSAVAESSELACCDVDACSQAGRPPVRDDPAACQTQINISKQTEPKTNILIHIEF